MKLKISLVALLICLLVIIKWNYIRSMKIVRKLNEALISHGGPLIYAAGHDHGLQVIKGEEKNHYVLVSGAASKNKLTYIKRNEDIIMSYRHTGYMELDYIKPKKKNSQGELVLLVFQTGKDEPVFRMKLD